MIYRIDQNNDTHINKFKLCVELITDCNNINSLIIVQAQHFNKYFFNLPYFTTYRSFFVQLHGRSLQKKKLSTVVLNVIYFVIGIVIFILLFICTIFLISVIRSNRHDLG